MWMTRWLGWKETQRGDAVLGLVDRGRRLGRFWGGGGVGRGSMAKATAGSGGEQSFAAQRSAGNFAGQRVNSPQFNQWLL
jgi:hypothetical protein